jgi:hypothetical protein
MWRASRRENGDLLRVIVLVSETLNKPGKALHEGFDFSFGVLAIWAVGMTI